MSLFKKVVIFGAAVAPFAAHLALAEAEAGVDELDDLDLENDGDDIKDPEMPSMEEMMAQMEGGMEGGMPGGGMPPQAPPKEIAMYNSTEEAETAIKARSPSAALYVFEGSEDSKVHEAAKKTLATEGLFGEVAFLKSDGANKLSVFKGTDEEVQFEGDFEDAEAVTKWSLENRIPAFGQIDGVNFEIYFEYAKKGLFWVCFDPKNNAEQVEKYSVAFQQAALAHKQAAKDIYPFVWLNVADFEEHAKQELGCKDFPTIVLQRGDLMSESEDVQVEKFIRSFANKEDEITAENVTKFFADIESGSLKAEPIPDPLDALDDDEEDVPAPAAVEDEEEL